MSESLKICRKCGVEKTPTEFYEKKGGRDGLNARCRACVIAVNRGNALKDPERVSERAREWRLKNPERIAQWKSRNINYFRDRERRLAEDPVYRLCRAETRSKRYRALRNEVILHLGRICQRCGFSDPRALQIDHINGGGNRELSTTPTTKYMKKIMVDATGYQLLCANCNWIKRWENDEHCCRTGRTVG